MRHLQADIPKSLEAIARGNEARMHRLETSDAARVEQLAVVEERLFRLDMRPRPIR